MPTHETPHPFILVVDDEPAIATLLRRSLEADGYLVRTACDGQTALDIMSEHRPEMLVLDLDMPRLDGFEVCRLIKTNPETQLLPILVLTGQIECDARLKAWNLGADEFLSKPFRTLDVVARCRSLLRQKELVDALESTESVVFALARTIEAKCRYTLGHSERVTQYALTLAEKIGLSATEQDILRRGAVLHDIGKLSIPDALLNKPGRLTPEEFAIIQRHPAEGARIVEPLRSARDVVPLVRWHHERLDGAGYPDGLFGGAIPLLTRVLSVADVYDALSSDRPYRVALTHEQCVELLVENAEGGGLDLELVNVFVASKFSLCQ